MSIRLIPDQAIGEAATHAGDSLGFEKYANVLAQAAVNTPGPFTIGVFAEWGMGKTSLLHMTQDRLALNDKVVTVWFNAWRYEREEHPIIPLAATIVQELRRQAKSKRVGRWGPQLIEALQAVASGFSGRAVATLPGVGSLEASFVAKDVRRRRRRASPEALLDESLYHGAFAALDALQLPADVRVVVFIDDLDRCFPHHAVRLLESIKLVLSQRGFVFVLGVAREVLEGYLDHRYVSDYGVAGVHGRTYLDKIVQLPFQIPQPAARIPDLCNSLLAQQPDSVATVLTPLLPTVATALGHNPRSIIRFVNNILIDVSVGTEFGTDAPIVFFAVARALQFMNADVFTVLTGDDAIADEVLTWRRHELKEHASAESRAAVVAEAMVANTALADLLYSDAGRSWLAQVGLRRTSVDFLIEQRQFSAQDTTDAPVRYDAFISYPATAKRDVINIIDALSSFDDLRVTIGQDLEVDSGWSRSLRGAVDQAQVLCYCVGPRLGRLQRGEAEVAREYGIPVIPVLLPGARREQVPLDLEELRVIDMSRGIDPGGIHELAQAIRTVRGRPVVNRRVYVGNREPV